ncbi:MAG: hypothetical protein RR623_05935 [Bacilli bacterium]
MNCFNYLFSSLASGLVASVASVAPVALSFGFMTPFESISAAF